MSRPYQILKNVLIVILIIIAIHLFMSLIKSVWR